MNLSDIREGELQVVFKALEETFSATGVDFYVIGAMATNVWYSRGGKVSGQTKDVDFAVLVGSTEDYQAIKEYLKQNMNFEDTKNNSFVMFSPSGVQVDILPFGEIEIDEGVQITGQGLSSIRVNGFMEVYQTGTEEVEVVTGHTFQVATLPAIVLLKLIAFDDRPEKRTKDARDIANIIHHFFDLQAEFIYTEHVDLFEEIDERQTLQEIASIVIGREIRKIIGGNDELLIRVKKILQTHIDEKDESAFVRNMVAATNKTVEVVVNELEYLLQSLND